MIPRKFHFIWLSADENEDNLFPKMSENYLHTFSLRNPEYEKYAWNNTLIREFFDENNYDELRDLYKNSKLLCQKADIARLAILHAYGGFYIDSDVECLSSFDPLLNNSFVVGIQEYEPPDNRLMYCNAVMGSEQKGEFITTCIKEVKNYINEDRTSAGPKFITALALQHKEMVTVLERKEFYPFMWWERQNYNSYKHAYTNHHWWGN